MSRETNLPVGNLNAIGPTDKSKMTKFDLEEVLNKIESIKQQGFGPEPSFLETVLSAGARERRQAIEDARISAIKVRKDLIDSLSGAIAVYVDTHKADLKVRGSTFVTASFSQQILNLTKIVEETITGMYEIYDKTYDDIQRIKNLTEEQKKEIIFNAFARASKREVLHEESFREICSNLAELVTRLSNEIGQRS